MDENPIVPEEAIIPQEELDLQLDDTEDVEALKARVEEMETFARTAAARAKKAEEENRLLKKSNSSQPTQPASPTNIEETVLLANGMDEELLEQLKKVAQVQGVSLIKAQNDPIFVAVKDNFEKEKKTKEASMPASRGGGQSKPKIGFDTPNLSREQHRELFKKANL